MKNAKPKNTTTKEGEVVKPDLSYKAPKSEEQEIDLLEQNFMGTRYQFDSGAQNNTSSATEKPMEAQRPGTS